MAQNSSPEKSGIYIHIPFCSHKCPYCDFFSLPLKRSPVSRRQYLQALLEEIRLRREDIPQGLCFGSIYIGGGTPSLLRAQELESILSALYKTYKFSPSVEVTIEANPGTVSEIWFREVWSLGINRISLGLQSLKPKGLKILGRIHSPQEALQAVEAARKAGFKNLNLDLIFGWPGQDLQDLEDDLNDLINLDPEHISCYELTIEKNTPLARQVSLGKIQPLKEGLVAVFYLRIEEFLTSFGLEHYEISNYARPGRYCSHNLIYWSNNPYLGLGAGAVSYLGGTREENLPDLTSYCQRLASGRPPLRRKEHLEKEARFRETVILGLRLTQGIRPQDLKDRFGIDPISYYRDEIKKFMEVGLLEFNKGRLRLTKKGRLLADEVMAYLV